MPIKVQCPACRAVHQVGDAMAGKRAKCKCGGVIAIPARRAPTAPSPAAQAPQGASPFGGLPDDEMDDLFGAPPGQASGPQPGHAPAPAHGALPANLVGASDGGGKKDNKPDPNALTRKDRVVAVMGIIAGVLAVPFGIIVAVLGLAGMVIWLAFKLYGEYKETLKKTLSQQKEELRDKGKRNENSVKNLLKAELSSNEPSRILNALRVFEKLDPLGFEFALLDMLKVKFPTIRQYAYSKLLEHKPFEFLEIVQREIKTEGDDEALRLANEVVNMFTHLASYELNDQSIRELIRSTEAKDRALGACLLSKMTDDKYLAFELELLRDINPHVHIAAIKTAGKLKRPEVWPVLVENLHLASYSNAAVSAICHTGESAFYQVDASFYKTGQYQSTMFRIVQILGRLRSKQSTELLWKKIDFPDKKIISEVLLSLSFTGFQARDFMK